MITEIGIVAGEIWDFLDKHGQVDLEQLTAGIKKSRELTLMSLGWLSREGHVLVKENGLVYQVSLRKKEPGTRMRKGVVLVVIIGIMLTIFALALAALFLMTQESRIAEHKIKRTRAFFAAQAGMVQALESLRNGTNPSGTIYIGSGIAGYPSAGLPVTITYTANGSGPGGTNPVKITVNY